MAVQNKRILVVDDDELLREFYTRVLTMQGYEPVCATNGDEALDILENAKEDFALIIMDLLMPVRTGWELVESMRTNPLWDRIPVLAITGLAGSFEEFEQIKRVCDAVLLKGDFELAKFNETVKRLVEEGRQSSES